MLCGVPSREAGILQILLNKKNIEHTAVFKASGVENEANTGPVTASGRNWVTTAFWGPYGSDSGGIWGPKVWSGKGSQNKLVFGPVLRRPHGHAVEE